MWAADADSPPFLFSTSMSFRHFILASFSQPYSNLTIHPFGASSFLFITANKQTSLPHSHTKTHNIKLHNPSLFHFHTSVKLSRPILPTSSYYQNLFILFCSRLLLLVATIMHQYCRKNNWWLLLNHSHEFFIHLIPLQGLYTRTHACSRSQSPAMAKNNQTWHLESTHKQSNVKREMSAYKSKHKYTYRVLRGNIISSMPNICWHIYNFNRTLVGHRDALSASWACACASLTAGGCVSVCVCGNQRISLRNIATCNFELFPINTCGEIWIMVWLALALGQAHNELFYWWDKTTVLK